jgi:3-oxoacyl-[acyl-carrier protein] reductase
MDLGITGRNALVCGSSQGLDFACAQTLLREGVNVTLNGRNSEKLEKAADALRGLGGEVRTIAADQSTVEGRKTIIETLGDLDILVNNNAGPPPGVLDDWDVDALLGAVNANMIPAIQFIRAFIPGMRARKFGRIVNITPHFQLLSDTHLYLDHPKYFDGKSWKRCHPLT